MDKVTVDDFIEALKRQVLENDGVVSEDEAHIIRHIERMDPTASKLEMFEEVLKAVYKNGELAEDESDIVAFARDTLKITDSEKQKILANLNLL